MESSSSAALLMRQPRYQSCTESPSTSRNACFNTVADVPHSLAVAGIVKGSDRSRVITSWARRTSSSFVGLRVATPWSPCPACLDSAPSSSTTRSLTMPMPASGSSAYSCTRVCSNMPPTFS